MILEATVQNNQLGWSQNALLAPAGPILRRAQGENQTYCRFSFWWAEGGKACTVDHTNTRYLVFSSAFVDAEYMSNAQNYALNSRSVRVATIRKA